MDGYNNEIPDYDILRKLQLTQLEILKYVNDFCFKNKIRYSIAYGTALGAVRHKGFIPWDDDMDICMLREDYNKFLSIWKDSDDYILQNNETNSDFKQTFSKIRKRNTAFVQKNDVGKSFHKGIFIDIFPFDRKPVGKFKQINQKINVMLFQLYFRGYVPETNGTILKLGSAVLLKIHRKSSYSKLAEKYLQKALKYNDDKTLPVFDTCTFSDMQKQYDNNLFDDVEYIDFENCKLPIFKSYVNFLKTCYGDYMKLPPKGEQTWFHHHMLVDFENEVK